MPQRAQERRQARRGQAEAEEAFFNAPLLVLKDDRHSGAEVRFDALGHTDKIRRLHITFTLRRVDTLIGVISARDMSAKERIAYEQSS